MLIDAGIGSQTVPNPFLFLDLVLISICSIVFIYYIFLSELLDK